MFSRHLESDHGTALDNAFECSGREVLGITGVSQSTGTSGQEILRLQPGSSGSLLLETTRGFGEPFSRDCMGSL